MFVLAFFVPLIGQDMSSFSKEKDRLLRDIELTNSLLESTRKAQENELQVINLIQAKIFSRQKLIETYVSKLDDINLAIQKTDSTLGNLEKDILIGKKEYEKLILAAFKRRNKMDFTLFFLSSESFNQAYERYRMINELNRYRKSQLVILSNTYQAYNIQKKKLDDLKMQLKVIIKDNLSEKDQLATEQTQKERFVKDLKSKERRLLSEIAEKKKQSELLEAKIRELILASKSSKSSYSNSDFGKNKGKLLWPVSNAIILSYFGEHDHPSLKGVKVKNNGVDFKLGSNYRVSNIFEGEVSRIVSIPGYNKAIIVRHGKFLTVYANMDVVYMKAGQHVKSGELLVEVFKHEGINSGVLHFEIWDENSKVNPVEWLKM